MNGSQFYITTGESLYSLDEKVGGQHRLPVMGLVGPKATGMPVHVPVRVCSSPNATNLRRWPSTPFGIQYRSLRYIMPLRSTPFLARWPREWTCLKPSTKRPVMMRAARCRWACRLTVGVGAPRTPVAHRMSATWQGD